MSGRASGRRAALIDTIKGGTLLFAYYPDAQWLHASRFLGDCTGQAGVHG